MSYKLWNLIRDAYQELGQLQVAKATGGSTSTVVDTKLVNTGKDDDWKDGSVIVLEDADGASAAPEGEFARVSAYVDSTGTLTIDTLSEAVSPGDVYGLVSAYFPLQQMVELANLALKSLGDLVMVDTSTLDTAINQTEYAASVAWKRRRPIRVDIQTQTGDADDNRWHTLYDWEFVPSAAGTTGLIVFKQQPTASRDLRIWYEDTHPRVSVYDDVIQETIHPSLAIAALVEKALVWQSTRLEGGNDFLLQRLNDARNELKRAKLMFPIWKPQRIAGLRFAGLGH